MIDNAIIHRIVSYLDAVCEECSEVISYMAPFSVSVIKEAQKPPVISADVSLLLKRDDK